jgi:uncharacterized protein YecE (DUF72 family)
MDFGKLPSVDRVDFSLPPDGIHNARVWFKAPAAPNPLVFIGATGYNMKAWVGKWYPPGAREKDFLRHYGAQFNAIEHNTTHYRIPDTDTVNRWRTETPPDFRFCPKIPQTISHAPDLGLNSAEIPLFCEQISQLSEKYGACFMQLPPHVGPDRWPLIKRFLEKWPSQMALAMEMRHPDFFKPSAIADDFFDLLGDYNIATVLTDVAGRRDVLHMRLTSAQVVIRFVGNGLHPSDYSRIDDWAQRLKTWFDAGLEKVYFFTHEPDNLLAPDLAAYTVHAFQKTMPSARLRGPQPVPGIQGSLF